MHHEIGHMGGYPTPLHIRPEDLPPPPVYQTWGPTPLGQHLSVATETVIRTVSKRAVCILLEYFLV